MRPADWRTDRHADRDGYADCDRDSDADCHCNTDCDAYGHGYSDAYGYGNDYADSDRHEHLMAVDVPQAGPRFTELTAQPPSQADPTGAPLEPGSGGVMLNDGVMQAILTSPVQQARVQAELSRERLKKLALDLAHARHVL